jgi:spore coat protein JB
MMDKQRAKLLREIQKVDFMLIELNLFLDTHPGDRQAIAEFNQYTQQAAVLRHQYEQLYGPLTLYGRHTPVQYPWRWVEEPWPWQI